MLTITATNFGVNPAFLNIKEYHEQNLLLLDGDISVDTTAAEYAGIRPMKLTVADLPFAKSRIATALVTAASDGVIQELGKLYHPPEYHLHSDDGHRPSLAEYLEGLYSAVQQGNRRWRRSAHGRESSLDDVYAEGIQPGVRL